jgi:uncharacterized membrane protein YfcA
MEFLPSTLLPAEVSPLLAVALVVLAGFTSALTAAAGIGGGLVLLGAMASVLPPLIVIPAHGVVQLGSNAGRAALLRQYIDPRILVPFVLGALAGVVIGATVFVALPSSVLKVILGLFILASVWLPKLKRKQISDRGFAVVGVLATFCTMFVGATGPFVAAFLSPDRLGRHALVATHATCMTVQHTLKVVAFVFLGFVFVPWVPLLAAMIGAGFLGTMLGKRLLDRLPEKVFAHVFKVVLSVLALRLLWTGLFP